MSETVLELRLQRIEEKLKEDYATQNHVRDAMESVVRPFTTTVGELKTSVNNLERVVTDIRESQSRINARHDKLLEDRAEYERKQDEDKRARDKAESEAKIALIEAERDELKNNTFAKRWGPGIAVGGGSVVLLKFFLDVIVPLVQGYQALPHK